MRLVITCLIYGILFITCAACGKDKQTDGCAAGAVTVRVITNQKATVQVSGGLKTGTWLVEDGAIDSKLVPCSELPGAFLQNGLKVIISGEVKATPATAGAPCCTYSFVVTSITKQ